MNKKSYKVIFLVFIILVNIGLITFLVFRFIGFKHDNNRDNSDNNDQNVVNNVVTPNHDAFGVRRIKYKKFTFILPEDVVYKEIDKYVFSLTASNWDAEIEIFLNLENDLFDNKERYYQMILDDGMDVEAGQFIYFRDNQLLVYNLREGSKNKLLTYYKMLTPFVMEINYHNSNNDFDTDSLDEIMDILMAYEFDYDSEKKYVYHSVTFD